MGTNSSSSSPSSLDDLRRLAVVGLAGTKHAGKTTIANDLIERITARSAPPEQLNYKYAYGSAWHAAKDLEDLFDMRIPLVVRISLAHAVRAEVAHALATPHTSAETIFSETTSPATKERWRTILQLWGTEIRRDLFDKDYWITKAEDTIDGMFASISAYKPRDLLILIDDVRFPNELNWLISRGGLPVYVRSETQDRRADQADHGPLADQHESEIAARSLYGAVDQHLGWIDRRSRVDQLIQLINSTWPEMIPGHDLNAGIQS